MDERLRPAIDPIYFQLQRSWRAPRRCFVVHPCTLVPLGLAVPSWLGGELLGATARLASLGKVGLHRCSSLLLVLEREFSCSVVVNARSSAS
jgi:hypothetical protein